ncbi:MAG TPA: hypothetical protein VFX45_02555 [Solirubrobacterales bacterium]|nr:hypothetical protein [Solirubrobacterales bacterium]
MRRPGTSCLRRFCGRRRNGGTPQTDVADRPAPDRIAMRATALIDLVEGRLETEVDVVGPETAWPIVGPALLAHATSSLESIVFRLRPYGAHNDSSRLLRSLYDHVVTFAWLAADTPARLPLWRKEDLKERLKIHREFADAGVQMLPDADRKQMESAVAGIEGNAPNLAIKAAMADQYWIPRIGGALRPDSLSSFRGFYTILFREQSGLVHATMRGLNHVTIDLEPPRKRVVREAPLGEGSPYGMATVVYGVGLLVAAQALDWPIAEEVNTIFERYP